MKHRLSFLAFMLVALMTMATGCGEVIEITALDVDRVNLAWEAPTLNEDNTPLTDLFGYRVYYGESSGAYTDYVTVFGIYTTVRIGNLGLGRTLYFAVTAFDINGNESGYSNEVVATLPITN